MLSEGQKKRVANTIVASRVLQVAATIVATAVSIVLVVSVVADTMRRLRHDWVVVVVIVGHQRNITMPAFSNTTTNAAVVAPLALPCPPWTIPSNTTADPDGWECTPDGRWSKFRADGYAATHPLNTCSPPPLHP